LRARSPELTWDFLYASCDHGSSKSGAFFARYLSEQSIDAAACFPIGDNEAADIKAAERHGIRPCHDPQAGAEPAPKFQRNAGTAIATRARQSHVAPNGRCKARPAGQA